MNQLRLFLLLLSLAANLNVSLTIAGGDGDDDSDISLEDADHAKGRLQQFGLDVGVDPEDHGYLDADDDADADDADADQDHQGADEDMRDASVAGAASVRDASAAMERSAGGASSGGVSAANVAWGVGPLLWGDYGKTRGAVREFCTPVCSSCELARPWASPTNGPIRCGCPCTFGPRLPGKFAAPSEHLSTCPIWGKFLTGAPHDAYGEFYTSCAGPVDPSQRQLPCDQKLRVHDKRWGWIGAGVVAGVSARPFMAFLGPLAPAVGGGFFFKYSSKIKTQRDAHSLEEVRQMKRLKAPSKAKDLLTWKANDKMLISRGGNIRFFVGVSAMLGRLTEAVSVGGNWEYDIHRLPSGLIQLKVAKNITAGVQSRARYFPMAGAQHHYDKAFEKDHIFTFDLRSPKAMRALDKALKGDLAFAQAMSTSQEIMNGSGVRLDRVQKQKRTENTPNAQLGVPWVVSFTKGKYKVNKHAEQFRMEDERIADIHMTTISKKDQYRRMRNPFKRRSHRDYPTLGIMQYKEEIKENFTKVVFTEIKDPHSPDTSLTERDSHVLIGWDFVNNHVTGGDAVSFFRKIRHESGMSGALLTPEMTVLLRTDRPQGMITIKYNIDIKAQQLDQLAQEALYSPENFSTHRYYVVENYFSDGNDKLGLCKKFFPAQALQYGQVSAETFQACKESIHLKVENKVHRAVGDLRKVVENTSLSDSTKAKHIAEILTQLKKNPLALMSVLHQGLGIQSKIEIKGTHFPPIVKTIPYPRY